MQHNTTNTLLVVCQSAHAFTRCQIPQPHCRVMRSGDDLWVCGLRDDTSYGVCVSNESVDVCLCSHVPNASCGITTGSDKNIQCWMQCHAVNCRQMAVVVTNYFVVLKIPAFDLTIFTAREQIWMSWGNSESSNGADVTCKRKLQFAASQVPDLDDTISSSRRKPFISRLNCNTSNPTQMTADDSIQLPGRVPLRLWNRRRFLGNELLLVVLRVCLSKWKKSLWAFSWISTALCTHNRQFAAFCRNWRIFFRFAEIFCFLPLMLWRSNSVEHWRVSVSSFDSISHLFTEINKTFKTLSRLKLKFYSLFLVGF